MRRATFSVGGMTCPHCEVRVQNAAKKVGAVGAEANYRRGTLSCDGDVSEATLKQALKDEGYSLLGRREAVPLWRRVLPYGAVLLLLLGVYALLVYTPLPAILGQFPLVRSGMGYGAVFVVGLMTSLHCMAMCGGINLMQSASAGQQSQDVLRANLAYNAGRVVSYTATGAVVGAIGQLFTVNASVQAAVQIVAAALMLASSLGMLELPGLSLMTLPPSLRAFFLRGGKWSSLRIGLLNGLMPCGPLQAVQLYALSTGSWGRGALSMLCFALGTVPLLLGFGLASGGLNKRFARPMRLVSGLLVAIMAVSMLLNGLSLLGVPLRFTGGASEQSATGADGVQEVYSELDWRGYPDITVRKGTPVHWVIHAEANRITGCNNEIVIPGLELRVPLFPGDNEITFTADEAGVIPYTCWMGMLHGSITVTEDP